MSRKRDEEHLNQIFSWLTPEINQLFNKHLSREEVEALLDEKRRKEQERGVKEPEDLIPNRDSTPIPTDSEFQKTDSPQPTQEPNAPVRRDRMEQFRQFMKKARGEAVDAYHKAEPVLKNAWEKTRQGVGSLKQAMDQVGQPGSEEGDWDVQAQARTNRNVYMFGSIMDAFGVRGAGRALDNVMPVLYARRNALEDAHRKEYQDQFDKLITQFHSDNDLVKMLPAAAGARFLTEWYPKIDDLATEISKEVVAGRRPAKLIYEFRKAINDPEMISYLKGEYDKKKIIDEMRTSMVGSGEGKKNYGSTQMNYDPLADPSNIDIDTLPSNRWLVDRSDLENAANEFIEKAQRENEIYGSVRNGNKTAMLEGLSLTQDQDRANEAVKSLLGGSVSWGKDGKATDFAFNDNVANPEAIGVVLGQLGDQTLKAEIGNRLKEALNVIRNGKRNKDMEEVQRGQSLLNNLIVNPHDDATRKFSRFAKEMYQDFATHTRDSMMHTKTIFPNSDNITINKMGGDESLSATPYDASLWDFADKIRNSFVQGKDGSVDLKGFTNNNYGWWVDNQSGDQNLGMYIGKKNDYISMDKGQHTLDVTEIDRPSKVDFVGTPFYRFIGKHVMGSSADKTASSQKDVKYFNRSSLKGAFNNSTKELGVYGQVIVHGDKSDVASTAATALYNLPDRERERSIKEFFVPTTANRLLEYLKKGEKDTFIGKVTDLGIKSILYNTGGDQGSNKGNMKASVKRYNQSTNVVNDLMSSTPVTFLDQAVISGITDKVTQVEDQYNYNQKNREEESSKIIKRKK